MIFISSFSNIYSVSRPSILSPLPASSHSSSVLLLPQFPFFLPRLLRGQVPSARALARGRRRSKFMATSIGVDTNLTQLICEGACVIPSKAPVCRKSRQTYCPAVTTNYLVLFTCLALRYVTVESCGGRGTVTGAWIEVFWKVGKGDSRTCCQ